MTAAVVEERRILTARPRLVAIVALLAAAVVGSLTATAGLLVPLLLAATGILVFLMLVPEAATVAFIGIIFLNLPVIASRFFGVPYIVAAGSVLLLLIPFLGNALRMRPLAITPALPLLFAYLAGLLFSSVFSERPSTGAVMIFIAEGIILYLLLIGTVRTPIGLTRALWAILLAGGVMGAISLHQEATGSYASNYAGLAQIESRAFTNVGDAAPTQVTAAEIGRPRLAGPIGEKNRYAQVLLIALPIAIFLAFSQRRRWLRWLAGGASLLMLAGILLTFSRGAAVALILVLMATAIVRRVRLTRLALAAAAALLVLTAVAPDYLLRLGTLSGVGGLVFEEANDPDGAILGRTTENLAALLTFVDHPLTGVGPGRFSQDFVADYGNQLGIRHLEPGREAHNLFLDVAANTGLVGLVPFLAIGWVTLAGLVRVRRKWLNRRDDYANIATGLLFSVGAYFVTGLFLHLSYERYFWLLIAVANCAIWILSREQVTRDEPAPVPPAGVPTPSGTEPAATPRTVPAGSAPP